MSYTSKRHETAWFGWTDTNREKVRGRGNSLYKRKKRKEEDSKPGLFKSEGGNV